MEKNVKIWFLADTHFGYKSDNEEILNDFIGYFEDTLIPIMKSEVGPDDILVHCGDVFDNRTTIGLNTIHRTISLFEKFSEVFNDIRIIVGNHDMRRLSSTNETSVDILKYIPHVKVYYDPVVEVINGKACLFNPWYENPDMEKELLDGVNVDYVFGHLMIGGSKMCDRSGVRVLSTGGVKMSDFKSAQVFAGHIHIRQDNKNIHYVGTPYHRDRGDRENVKGITVLDVRSGETTFIENKVSPQYIKDNIYDILNLTMGDLKERWYNNRVELVIKNKDYAMCNFDMMRDCLKDIYREFVPKGDGSVVELDTLKMEDGDCVMKSGDDYITEYISKRGTDPRIAAVIFERIKEYRDRL